MGFNTKSWSSMTWMIWGTPMTQEIFKYFPEIDSNSTHRPRVLPRPTTMMLDDDDDHHHHYHHDDDDDNDDDDDD